MRIEATAPELTTTSFELEKTGLDRASTIDATPVAGSGVEPRGVEGTLDFGQLLKSGLDETKRLHAEATAKTDALARGASDDLHGTMITVKEAEISMKLVGNVRNKLLDAFHELWRINL